MALDASRLGAALKDAATSGDPGETAARWNAIAAAIIDEVKKAVVQVPAVGLISAAPGAPVTGQATGTVS